MVNNIKEYIEKEFKDAGGFNADILQMGMAYLRIYSRILTEGAGTTLVRRVEDWEGDRETFEYIDLLESLGSWAKIDDYDSASLRDDLLDFISWAILDIRGRNIAQLTAKKQSRLAYIKEEQKKLDKEIDELMNNKRLS